MNFVYLKVKHPRGLFCFIGSLVLYGVEELKSIENFLTISPLGLVRRTKRAYIVEQIDCQWLAE